jgi:hypothetical protein
MKLLTLILMLTLPMMAQGDLAEPIPDRLTELPAQLDTDSPGPAIGDLRGHCGPGRGVWLAPGVAYTIKACADLPPACNSWPCCLPNERSVVVHEHPPWAAPTEKDGEGVVTKGGDPKLVLGAAVDARLMKHGLCIPTVTKHRQRAVVRRLLKQLFDTNKAWFVRRIPARWVIVEEVE